MRRRVVELDVGVSACVALVPALLVARGTERVTPSAPVSGQVRYVARSLDLSPEANAHSSRNDRDHLERPPAAVAARQPFD